jgi:hypothetical protein
MTKRKIAQDNPALMALGAALVSGAVEAGTSITQKATGPGSPLSVDEADGDGVSLFVRWAEQNLEPAEMRTLADALREAAEKDGGERQRAAMDSAWRRNPDAFERRFPGSRRIRQGW